MRRLAWVMLPRDAGLLTLLLALVATAWGQPKEDQGTPQVLVKTGMTWQSPRSIHATYRYAQVWLVMLYPDGRLTEWGSTLYRDRKTRRVRRPYGESYGVAIGRWIQKRGAVIGISTKLVYADVLKVRRCGMQDARVSRIP